MGRISGLLHTIQTQAQRHALDWNLDALDGITLTTALEPTVSRLKKLASRRNAAAAGLHYRSRTVTAGCALKVPRGRTHRWHVVLDMAYLTDLSYAPDSPGTGTNIVAHELAHVAFLRSRQDLDWDAVAKSRTWRTIILRELALAIWDEYAACRLSAQFGDRLAVTHLFHDSLAAALSPGPPKLRLFNRKQWTAVGAAPTFIRAAQARAPLHTAAYLIGHLDGLGVDAPLSHLSTPARTSTLSPCWEPLRMALRSVWTSAGWTAGAEDMDAVSTWLVFAIRTCGGDRIFDTAPESPSEFW